MIEYIPYIVSIYLANLIVWAIATGLKRNHWKAALLYTAAALFVSASVGLLFSAIRFALGSNQQEVLQRAVANRTTTALFVLVGFLLVPTVLYCTFVLLPRKVLHRLMQDKIYHRSLWKIGIATYLLYHVFMFVSLIWIQNPADLSLSFKANFGNSDTTTVEIQPPQAQRFFTKEERNKVYNELIRKLDLFSFIPNNLSALLQHVIQYMDYGAFFVIWIDKPKNYFLSSLAAVGALRCKLPGNIMLSQENKLDQQQMQQLINLGWVNNNDKEFWKDWDFTNINLKEITSNCFEAMEIYGHCHQSKHIKIEVGERLDDERCIAIPLSDVIKAQMASSGNL